MIMAAAAILARSMTPKIQELVELGARITLTVAVPYLLQRVPFLAIGRAETTRRWSRPWAIGSI